MSSRRRIPIIIGATLLVLLAGYCLELALPKRDYFIQRRGTVDRATAVTEDRGDSRHDSVQLASTTGLEVELRVVRPSSGEPERLPVVLLLGGHETGKDAVDLVGAPDGIAYAAIDYPNYHDAQWRGFWESAGEIRGTQKMFLDAPPALSLALSWLLQQPWVDDARVELAGVSLGVPFAAPAGALDDRISRVWLMHGAGDNYCWLYHNGERQIASDALRALTARLVHFAVYGNSFDTVHWIRETAPRPLMIVAARDDDFVPAVCRESLVVAANSPFVELLWTEGRHVGPRREAELGQLLEIVRTHILGTPEARPPGPIHPLEPLAQAGRGDRKLVPLPDLDDSDGWFRLELANLFGRELDELLLDAMLIERVVGTVDNLPRRQLAERIRPVRQLPSNFVAAPLDEATYELGASNFARYEPLVNLLATADIDELVDAYRRFYPLLQESYIGLGYPNGYFNDRVVEVIDHLLSTPATEATVRLVRPNVLFEFEDPELEALSTGQKLLVRMGSDNATRVKRALEEFRARIARD